MGARVSSNEASQVTSTQALKILKQEIETIPDTEMPVSDVGELSEVTCFTNSRNAMHRKSEATTQPPNPASVAISDFTLLLHILLQTLLRLPQSLFMVQIVHLCIMCAAYFEDNVHCWQK